jgi:hypothetical protein
LDCNGPSQNIHDYCKEQKRDSFKYLVTRNNQVVFSSYSQKKTIARPGSDIGLPAAIQPVQLAASDRKLIQHCTKRQYLFSYQGRIPGQSGALFESLNNNKDILVRDYPQDTHASELLNSTNFEQVLKRSTFAGVPVDDLFSYQSYHALRECIKEWLNPAAVST